MQALRRWWIAVLCAASCACSANQSAGETPSKQNAEQSAPSPSVDGQSEPEARVVFSPTGREPVTVRVEVARTHSERQRGLMFRKQMDDGAGMLFLFEQSEQLSFWMRNTYIPLDMIFVEPSLRVLGVVENAEPMTDTPREVPGDSQYVVEVNAGFARRHGLTKGTALRFEGIKQ